MEFHRLASAQDPLFTAAFALYEQSFPKYEQRLIDKQTAVMTNPLYHFDIITDNGVFTGILLYWDISRYAYIEHFAIHPSLRGKALGSRSLEAFFEKHPAVILEIDPPENQVSIRREYFYRRLGFQNNNYAHTHPPYQKKFQPHKLVVMSYPEEMTESEYLLFRRELSEIVMKDTA